MARERLTAQEEELKRLQILLVQDLEDLEQGHLLVKSFMQLQPGHGWQSLGYTGRKCHTKTGCAEAINIHICRKYVIVWLL